MIKSLKAQNFQSWESLNIEFCEGINVIIGNSNQGKTAIIRQLDWLINNRPSGDGFRSKWTLNRERKRGESISTIVEIELSEGIFIGREKSKSDNLYYIIENKKKEEFRAFGKSNVPKPISDILRLQDINLQQQMDSPFLLSMRSSDAGRYLNEIAHLEKINISFSNINKWENAAKSEKKYIEAELESKLEELEEYTFLDQADNELKKLESLNQKIEEKEVKLYELQNLTSNIEKEEKELKKFTPNLEEKLQEINTFILKAEKINRYILENTQLFFDLKELLVEIYREEKKIENSCEKIGKLEKEFKELSSSICPIYDVNCPLKEKME